jgi:hypothetical protein
MIYGAFLLGFSCKILSYLVRPVSLLQRVGMYIFPALGATARMAKLVDARDLKSLVRKDVPVRPRLRAPFKIKGLRALLQVGPCWFLVRNY